MQVILEIKDLSANVGIWDQHGDIVEVQICLSTKTS